MSNQHSDFSLQHALGADYLVEDVFSDVRVDGAERVVEEVYVAILVHGAGQADTLLLTTTQVDTLGEIKLGEILAAFQNHTMCAFYHWTRRMFIVEAGACKIAKDQRSEKLTVRNYLRAFRLKT